MRVKYKVLSSWKGQYFVDLVLTFAILLLPFIIYLHLLFDSNSNAIEFFGYKYHHGFLSNETLAWYFLASFINLLYPLLIFTTSSGKWRYFLIPIILYFFFMPIIGLLHADFWTFFLSKSGLICIATVSIILLTCNEILKWRKLNELTNFPKDIVLGEMFFARYRRYNNHITNLLKSKSNFTSLEYLYRIYHLNRVSKEKYKPNELKINREGDGINSKLTTNYLRLTLIILTIVLLIDNWIP